MGCGDETGVGEETTGSFGEREVNVHQLNPAPTAIKQAAIPATIPTGITRVFWGSAIDFKFYFNLSGASLSGFYLLTLELNF
jgi:hypothetical protein